jgi:hypothetical protein
MSSDGKNSQTDVAPSKELKEVNVATTSVADSDGLGSTDDHIFSDPIVAGRWQKVYDAAKYEGRHRFDPSYTWTAAEEKALVRKSTVFYLVSLSSTLTKK